MKTKKVIKETKLPKTWGQLKKMQCPEFFVPSIPANPCAFSNNSKATKPKCRFCGGETRALNNNGVISNGYKEWDYVCKSCGKVQ